MPSVQSSKREKLTDFLPKPSLDFYRMVSTMKSQCWTWPENLWALPWPCESAE